MMLNVTLAISTSFTSRKLSLTGCSSAVPRGRWWAAALIQADENSDIIHHSQWNPLERGCEEHARSFIAQLGLAVKSIEYKLDQR